MGRETMAQVLAFLAMCALVLGAFTAPLSVPAFDWLGFAGLVLFGLAFMVAPGPDELGWDDVWPASPGSREEAET